MYASEKPYDLQTVVLKNTFGDGCRAKVGWPVMSSGVTQRLLPQLVCL